MNNEVTGLLRTFASLYSANEGLIIIGIIIRLLRKVDTVSLSYR